MKQRNIYNICPKYSVFLIFAALTVFVGCQKKSSQGEQTGRDAHKKTFSESRIQAAYYDSLGYVYEETLHDYVQARINYKNALILYKEISSDSGVASTLTNLGYVEKSDGNFKEAITYHLQALTLRTLLNTPLDQAESYNNIGEIYQQWGRYEQASKYFDSSFKILESVKEKYPEAEVFQAVIYTNRGLNCCYLGEYNKAISFQEIALPIHHKNNMTNYESATLLNLGFDYYFLKNYRKAIDYFQKARILYYALHDTANLSVVFGHLAGGYNALGKNALALQYSDTSLILATAVKNSFDEAVAHYRKGTIYLSLHDFTNCIKQLDHALAIYRKLGMKEREATTNFRLMQAYRDYQKVTTAIIFGKEAINGYQEVRKEIRHLLPETQHDYMVSKNDAYRELADILITQNRLIEAQRVLDMLKEEEYFDFLRGGENNMSSLSTRIGLSPEEDKAHAYFLSINDSIIVMANERSELLTKKVKNTIELERLKALDSAVVAANMVFQKYLDDLEVEVRTSSHTGANAFMVREAQALSSTLRELGEGVVAIYTVVTNDKYHIILITPDLQIAGEYKISSTELTRKIIQLRSALSSARQNPLPYAKELYRIIIQPIINHLDNAKATTLMWSLDGILRYIPINALHDGSHYMLERFRNVIVTPASQSRLLEKSEKAWTVAGFGVTLAHDNFPALPGVAEELQSIIQTGDNTKGIVTGTIKMDNEFTFNELRSSLRQSVPIVHIASHFQFDPTNEKSSFLLLGDGSHLTLEKLEQQQSIFNGVDLLTLSGCNTAMGSSSSNGKEVEGFGVLAQRQGAKSVIATLWAVSDKKSTPLLMKEFYRLKMQNPLTSKIEALQKAQLSLLRGTNGQKSENQKLLAIRGSSKKIKNNTLLPDETFSHPFYWAPFILIGNWR